VLCRATWIASRLVAWCDARCCHAAWWKTGSVRTAVSGPARELCRISAFPVHCGNAGSVNVPFPVVYTPTSCPKSVVNIAN
jgi:hypothetical protein